MEYKKNKWIKKTQNESKHIDTENRLVVARGDVGWGRVTRERGPTAW